MTTISCIIAAYNEAARISEVLKAVENHPLLMEVIVVDDGSKDGTADVVRKFKNIKLIQHEINKGKSKAVATAIAAAKGDLICAIDADLEGFTAESVTRLLKPVLAGEATIAFSLRQNCPWFYRPIHFDILSGERVYPKSFLEPHLDEIRRLSKFGIEVFMNHLIIQQKIPIIVVFLPGVVSPLKYHKSGYFSGSIGELKMVRDILKTVSLFEFVSQIYHLMKLRVATSQKFPNKKD